LIRPWLSISSLSRTALRATIPSTIESHAYRQLLAGVPKI
jgi:hypothetical protein